MKKKILLKPIPPTTSPLDYLDLSPLTNKDLSGQIGFLPMKLSELGEENLKVVAEFILANDPTKSYTLYPEIDGVRYRISGVTVQMLEDVRK